MIFYKDIIGTTSFKYFDTVTIKPLEYLNIYVVNKLNNDSDNIFLCKNITSNVGNYSDNLKYCKNVNTDEKVVKDENLIPYIVSRDNKKTIACDEIVSITLSPTPISTIIPTSTLPTITFTIPSQTPMSTIIPTSTIATSIPITTTIIVTSIPVADYKTWNIKLNKIIPYTSSGEESIEIINNSSEDKNLKGWILDDSKTTSTKFKIFTDKDIIKAKSTLIITASSSVLNNTGDDVYLISPDGTDIDKFTYTDTPKDGIWEYSNESWILKKLTLDDSGSVLGTTDSKISIKDARNLNNESNVKVQGTLTVKKDILGSNIFYIQDSESGIRIDYDKDSSFQEGDLLEITGVVSEIREEKRIEAENIDFIKKESVIKPQLIKTNNINEDLEGVLLTLKGMISDTNGNTIEVDDGTGKITVSIQSTTNIKKPYTRVGYYSQISGILSQYGTKDSKPFYRLLPRYQSDLQIAKTQEELANTGVGIIINIAIGILIIAVNLFVNLLNRKSYV